MEVSHVLTLDSPRKLARLDQAFRKQSCTMEAATSSSPTENVTNRRSRARCVRTRSSISSSSESARSRLPNPRRLEAIAVCIWLIDAFRIVKDYRYSTHPAKVAQVLCQLVRGGV